MSSRSLREGFVKPSRCLHEAFTQWARRGAFAKGSRRLHERFVKTSRALKVSRRDREAFAKSSRRLHPSPRRRSWSLLGGFARGSWRLHLETIRQIMTSPPFLPCFRFYDVPLILFCPAGHVLRNRVHSCCCCCCILPINQSGLNLYPVIYVVPNPVRGHKEVRRSTGHIMVATRYSDQQGSKSRQKVMRLYKQWHRPISKRFIKLPLLHIESNLDRLGLLSPTHNQRYQQQSEQITLQPVLINKSKFIKATHRTKIRKIEIPRPMVVEALSS